MIDNIPRILDKGYNIDINCKWDIPDVFKWIHNNSDMSETEMLNTYNCGIGMVIVFDKNVDKEILSDNILTEIGKVIKSNNYQINTKLF